MCPLSSFHDNKSEFTFFVISENGTQMLSDQVRNAVTIPRAQMNDDAKYQLIVTAYNDFGASQSDLVAFCVKDTGKLSFLLSKYVYVCKFIEKNLKSES